MRNYVSILIVLFIVQILNFCPAQSTSFIGQFQDERLGTKRDGLANSTFSTSDGRVLLFHNMANTNDSDRTFNQLAMHVFDTCGSLIEQVVWSMDSNSNGIYLVSMQERGDSLYLIGSCSKKEADGIDALLLTIHKNSFRGEYRQMVSAGNSFFTGMALTTQSDVILAGNIGVPPGFSTRNMLIELDQNYNIKKSLHFYATSPRAQCNITSIKNKEYFVSTAYGAFVLNEQLDVLSYRSFVGDLISSKSIVDEEGVVLCLSCEELANCDGATQLVKVDYNWNIIWSSPYLGVLTSSSSFNYLYVERTNSGGIVLVPQKRIISPTHIDLIEVTELSDNGQIMQQISIEGVSNPGYRNYVSSVAYYSGFVWIVQNTVDNSIKFHRVELDDPQCETSSFLTQNGNAIEWFEDDEPPNFVSFEVEFKSHVMVPKAFNLPLSFLCETPYPLFDLIPDDTMFCEGYALEVNLDTINQQIFWSDGSTLAQRQLTKAGSYSYGYGACQTEYAETINIVLDDCRCKAFIPDAFSPNNDGFNDFFQVFIPCEHDAENELKVFDRWGNKVFHSNDVIQNWDGRANGKICSEGVYVYEYSYLDTALPVPELVRRIGEVLLMR